MDTKEMALEQYKSLVGDVGNIGQRYATANGFYLSVLTALLGVLAYVGTGKDAVESTYAMMFLVAVFAIAICWIWWKTIAFYGRLFGAKFCLLKKLELELPVQVYAEESDLAYKELETDPDKKCTVKAGGKTYRSLTALEAVVPWILGAFFLAVAVWAAYLFFSCR